MSEQSAANKKFQKELNSGTVGLVLLGVLGQAKEPLYGYQIAKLVSASGTDVAMMKQGSLYPVLRSLEKQGFLESTVEPSLAGPPRRYYRITDLGRRALEEWTTIWRHNKGFVDAVLKGNYND